MSKSEVNTLQGVVEAVLSDYLDSYPADAREIDRDISRLALLSRTRGLGVFLLDLPACGKHFDRCLADGRFTPFNGPLSGPKKKGAALPKLFWGMLSRVFDCNSGCLRVDVDVTVVKFLREVYYFAKGYEHDCTRARTAEAVRDFFNVERGIRTASLSWEDDCVDLSGLRHLHFGDDGCPEDLPLYAGFQREVEPGRESPSRGELDVLQRVCDQIAASFGIFQPAEEAISRPKHGPGAVADLRQGESKYSFPNWPAKLDAVFPMSEFSYLNYDYWAADLFNSNRSLHEPPSKLHAVPKTAKGPRLIASEPTAHQWCQQVILRFLVDGIGRGPLRRSISLNDQEPSRRLALRASIDGRYATIDLSAASDRLSCWTIERFFRRNPPLIEAFHAVRSRWIRNAVKGTSDISPGDWILRKFTTMGSAVTFPTQSIVFASVAIAAIVIDNGWEVNKRTLERAGRQTRVFGDDIIVPSHHYGRVCQLLEYLGLEVNRAKSFGTGLFREACGMDAFMGYDVTPARINSVADPARPTTVAAAVDSSNNFFKKGFWRAAAAVESTLPPWVVKNLRVVQAESGKPGLVSFVGESEDHLVSRWNKDLHRHEVRAVSVYTPVQRHGQLGEHDLFQYFTERPNPDSLWKPGRVRVGKSLIRTRWEPSTTIQVLPGKQAAVM